MIFEVDFWARFSRKKIGHGFWGPYGRYRQYSLSIQFIRTVEQKSRQKTEKIRVWFLLLGTQIETEIYLPGWDKLVWYFMCIAVNDKLLLKNKNTLSDWFSPSGFFLGHWPKIVFCVIKWRADFYFLSLKRLFTAVF